MASIEKRERDGQTVVARALPHPGRRPAQQDLRPQGRRRAVPRHRRVLQERRLVRRPGAARGHGGGVGQRWLAGQAHLKPTTRAVRRDPAPPHRAALGPVRLSNVSHADVQAWVTTLSRTSSPATVRKVHRVLSLILDLAVRDGRLARNVAEKINLPRPARTSSATSPSRRSRRWPPSAATPRSSASTAPRQREQRDLPAGRAVPGLHRRPVRRDGRAPGRPPRPRAPPRGDRGVGHRGPGPGPGLGHHRRPTSAARCRSRGSSPTSSPTTSRAGSPRTWCSPASAAASRCGSHLPARPLRRRRQGDRHTRPAPARAPAHRRQPGDRQRRRRQGRPADARAQLGDDDAGHLRAPLRGPARRGRRRHGPRPESRPTAPHHVWRRCPVLPQCCPSPIRREMKKGPLPAFLLVRTPFRICTPDGIRTRATALRGRRARPLHNGGLAH